MEVQPRAVESWQWWRQGSPSQSDYGLHAGRLATNLSMGGGRTLNTSLQKPYMKNQKENTDGTTITTFDKEKLMITIE